MSYFKKLFNRITGRPEDSPDPSAPAASDPPPEVPQALRDPTVSEPIAPDTALEEEPPSASAPEIPPSLASESMDVAAQEPSSDAASGWFGRLREGLSKSSRSLTGSLTAIFVKRKLDKATLEDLEDVLLQADLGLPATERIVKAIAAGRYDREIEADEVRRILAEEIARTLSPVERPFAFGQERPFVILVVGVNGAGKTTTIGKLGAIATREGYRVMFAACDTFRAAAIEQLAVWGERIGAETMTRPQGADAAGLAFDALKKAREEATDILFIDTAGRLQNKAELMAELEKIVRVLKKLDPGAPHAVLLVLDATTGQNALAQAEAFTRVAGVTGIVMTKLDGTAKGGILVAIAERFKLPVHAVGVGERIEDLQPFDAARFARAMVGLS